MSAKNINIQKCLVMVQSIQHLLKHEKKIVSHPELWIELNMISSQGTLKSKTTALICRSKLNKDVEQCQISWLIGHLLLEHKRVI